MTPVPNIIPVEQCQGITATVMPRLDFRRDRYEMVVPQGTALSDMVTMALPGVPEGQWQWVRVSIGEWVIPIEHWHVVRPKPGMPIVIRLVPSGGNLRMVLSVVVTIAALALGQFWAAPLASAIGVSTGVANALIVGATMVAGTLLVNALVPQKQTRPDKPKYNISGGSNTLSPDAPVPLVLGTIRVAPPYATLPYTEDIGDDQYYYASFLVGYGPVKISDVRIGDTPIDDFKGVTYEVREGWPDDLPLSLINQQVVEDGDQAQLTVADGPVYRVSGGDASALSVSVRFPGGLYYVRKKGDRKAIGVQIRIRCRLAGTSVWQDVTTLWPRRNTQKEFRVSHRWNVPVRGRYEIEVTRLTFDTDESPQYSASCFLSAIRTFRPEYPINMPTGRPLALIAVKIKASRQLQGALDSVNCLASSIAPDWDSVNRVWVTRETRSPAALARLLQQGPQVTYPVPDSRLGLTEIASWHEHCAAKGLTYDAYVSDEVKLRETLADVCGAGRARPLDRGDRWGVVVDKPVSTVTAVISPRNARGISWTPQYVRYPDAVRVSFYDRSNNFKKAERVIPWIGFTGDPQITEEWEFPGLTDAGEVWIAARRRMHELALRPFPYTATQDIEHLAVEPGDRVMLSHHMIDITAQAVEIKRLANGFIILDEAVTMDAGQDYRVRIRGATGASRLAPVVNKPGSFPYIRLATPLDPPPEPGDLVLFGRYGEEAVDAIVSRIEPGDDLSAVLTMLPHAPELEALTDAEIPPVWDGRAGGTVNDNRVPEAARFAEVSSGYEIPDEAPGTIQLLLVPALDEPVSIAFYTLRHRLQGAGAWTELDNQQATVSIAGYTAGNIVEFAVRAIGWNGQVGPWSDVLVYTVLPMVAIGPVVATFNVDRLSNGVRRYSWTFVDPPASDDIADQYGVQIRYRAGTWSSWDDLTDLNSGLLYSMPYESTTPEVDGLYSFAIRATDFDGAVGPPKFLTLSTQPAKPVKIAAIIHLEDVDVEVTMSVAQDAGYVRIFRSLASAAVTTEVDVSGRLDAPAGTIVAWTDTGAAASGEPSYRYRARAENAAGVQSLPSNEALP